MQVTMLIYSKSVKPLQRSLFSDIPVNFKRFKKIALYRDSLFV